jgi:hypothetical protein
MNSPNESVYQGASEQEGDRDDGVGQEVGAGSVKAIGALAYKDVAFLEKSGDSRNRHESEEGDREEAVERRDTNSQSRGQLGAELRTLTAPRDGR